MKIKLTMVPLIYSHAKELKPTDPVVRYTVNDERGKEIAFITNTRTSTQAPAWQVSGVNADTAIDVLGDFPTAELALSALKRHLAQEESLSKWTELMSLLQKEIDSIRTSSGEVIELKRLSELDASLIWETKAKHMRITYLPLKRTIRWETPARHGFDPLSEFLPSVAVDLLQRLSSM